MLLGDIQFFVIYIIISVFLKGSWRQQNKQSLLLQKTYLVEGLIHNRKGGTHENLAFSSGM